MFLISHVDIGFLMMFYTTISMSLKFREEDQVLPSFESLMDKLSLLASNIEREVINVLDSFLSFL
jgi:hypothetical protein